MLSTFEIKIVCNTDGAPIIAKVSSKDYYNLLTVRQDIQNAK